MAGVGLDDEGGGVGVPGVGVDVLGLLDGLLWEGRKCHGVLN